MQEHAIPHRQPTQSERMRIPYRPERWPKPVADRVLAHVMIHRPATVEALRRLFKPHWQVSKRDLTIRIGNAPRGKAAGITVTEKGELRFPTNSFLENKGYIVVAATERRRARCTECGALTDL